MPTGTAIFDPSSFATVTLAPDILQNCHLSEFVCVNNIDKIVFVSAMVRTAYFFVIVFVIFSYVHGFSSSFAGRRTLSLRMSEDGPKKMEPIQATIKPIESTAVVVTEDEVSEPIDLLEETEEQRYKREKLAEIAERKAAEVFVTQETGKFECQACGYVYDEAKGYAKRNVPAGTKFENIDNFRCPQCGANKKYFVAETETLSGFKENLKYGLGTNAMTAQQKSLFIYGGLFLGFAVFMSGYLLD